MAAYTIQGTLTCLHFPLHIYKKETIMNPAHVLPLIITAFTGLAACAPKGEASEIPANEIVGNDRDAHNCIGSAGYSWSEVRQSCIRVWEDGVALEDRTVETPTSSAYIIAGADNENMELFLPIGGSVMLKSTSGGKLRQWQDGDEVYTLVEDAANGFVVYSKGGDVMYAQASEINDLGNDETRAYGIIKSVEDSGYPMFILMLEIPEHGKIYDLTVNAETLAGGVELMNGLIGKYATVFYTSDIEKMVLDIHNADGSIFTDDEPFEENIIEGLTGMLSGATSPSGDLPIPFTITSADGTATEFSEFITDELIAQNGKIITVYYYERYTNQITRIEPSEE